jgi:hypothetical protein
MLLKHWHHCFLAEFSKDDPDFFKEASSYNQLSPHKVMSRSNLHFLYNYNLVIYNDCGHFNVTLWARNTNTNTFYPFRCPQSLEMTRLYLYKKCKLERDMTLCGDNWLYKKLLWKNQGRPCWIQRENNDVNVYAKSSLSVKKDISVQQICFKFSWHIKVLYQRVSLIFCFH